MNVITLKPGKEKSLLRRHPWVYATGIATTSGRCEPGATVTIRAADGRFLARGAYSPESQIRARVWTFDEDEPVDHALIKRRVSAAIAHRGQWVRDTDAVRLVFGESDRIPGLIVDYYGNGERGQLVCQFNSAGVEQWKTAIVQALVKETGCPNVYERSDAAVREREGLPLVTGVLAGAEPDPALSVTEHGVRYYVDVRNGHKTGFYVDQRDNRKLVGDLAQGREVLNCFCYTGGFSLAALRGGATAVTSIDSSGEALKIAANNVTLNGFDAERATWLDADVFKTLRNFRAEGRQFDLIVLDPPKFAPSAQHIDRAARAYKEINLVGMQLLRPGGLLFTYSCSGAISMELFQKIVAGAVTDARADARILRRLSAGTDHPMSAAFPEGEYLKGLLLEKI
ncbi:class I SAM-dependent rRNA methyltransferase [Cupriavidus plantarum]|uniref:class I SAM-dependent rRNA methyltransferase n=1 Tax=Cupriavidus plantarum TaxID=942865 RepID=UPI0015C97462|nr:class I SAM-dependent rRNA methyltransferase [Cupriavidus plantarum]NYH97705.1 23S rRNA (cytosine1962-C5)-methyltransferase [Cupriavidus plantarum]CAG2126908.1 Ribosomal RNA large subunit methyltransferase I [Cupriavidus plantarum]SMR67688.1 SAM-dependent methyltransferase /23S rRNA m(5)C-1962 methyltransferase [Cupriavidus plantarum]